MAHSGRQVDRVSENSDNDSSVADQPRWISQLPEFLEKKGFSTVASDVYKEKPWQTTMFMENWCQVASDFAAVNEKAGRLEGGNEMRSLASGAYAEIKKGAFYNQKFRVVVGRKPE